jgi:hypothetical protein
VLLAGGSWVGGGWVVDNGGYCVVGGVGAVLGGVLWVVGGGCVDSDGLWVVAGGVGVVSVVEFGVVGVTLCVDAVGGEALLDCGVVLVAGVVWAVVGVVAIAVVAALGDEVTLVIFVGAVDPWLEESPVTVVMMTFGCARRADCPLFTIDVAGVLDVALPRVAAAADSVPATDVGFTVPGVLSRHGSMARSMTAAATIATPRAANTGGAQRRLGRSRPGSSKVRLSPGRGSASTAAGTGSTLSSVLTGSNRSVSQYSVVKCGVADPKTGIGPVGASAGVRPASRPAKPLSSSLSLSRVSSTRLWDAISSRWSPPGSGHDRAGGCKPTSPELRPPSSLRTLRTHSSPCIQDSHKSIAVKPSSRDVGLTRVRRGAVGCLAALTSQHRT